MAISLNEYYRQKFGCKVYKLSLDGGFTCPNRDGTIGIGGCTFCNGSGEFAEGRCESIALQLEKAKAWVANKIKCGKYIAYFQAFTSTYAPLPVLEALFTQAIAPKDIVGLSVGTRPDCLPQPVIDLLAQLNKEKPVSVELGLQTIHDTTAQAIRRGFDSAVYLDAVKRLKAAGLEVVTHIILGLPGETPEYTEVLDSCLALLPEHTVIHRITGDGAKKDLIAPLWSADKKRVLNYLNTHLIHKPPKP